MAAVDVDGSKAESHTQVRVEDTDMSLTQLVRLREETEAEIETLCNLMYQLNKSRVQYERSVETVSKLNSSMDGLPALIPLTNNMYIRGDLCKTNEPILSLGNEYQMEVDKETAINYLFTKIQRIKTKIGVAQKILASKILDRERLRKVAADKYLEEHKKEEFKPFAKFPSK